MKAFAELLDRLYYTHGNLGKAAILKRYFATTPDPDRGWAVAAIAGTLRFDLFKRSLVRELIMARVDPVLFELSYDYIGETSETVAHLWPVSPDAVRLDRLPVLSEVIEQFSGRSKAAIADYVVHLLDNMTPPERWALLKLGTSSLRIGVSARFLKQILADFGQLGVNEVEEVWHALTPPYVPLLDWLERRAPKPDTRRSVAFHPVMLAHPLDDADFAKLAPEDYVAEWKFDGIRVQLVSNDAGRALFSRSGDDIGGAFPEVLERAAFKAVIDGELTVKSASGLGSFNDLQQRLNRKQPSRKLLTNLPAQIIAYDALLIGDDDLRGLPFAERRARLETWHGLLQPAGIVLSEILSFNGWDELMRLRQRVSHHQNLIEGLMLKHKDSLYVPGRPKGQWFKWKKDPLVVDAVLMYAQRGTGKRSSYYSDYTFGLWRGGQLLPIGKAYFGFTDDELKALDKWIRNNTVARFGPVREVAKNLVFEVAFDSVQTSSRHKSGLALRFPRINRIRWDKPAAEADELAALEKWVRLAENRPAS